MAKRKPDQPLLGNIEPIGPPPPNGSSQRTQAAEENDFSQDPNSRNWSSTEDTAHAYRKLDNALRDFVYGISRGYSIRHACRMAGENYERMLDYLNPKDNLFKPDLLRLVDKARAIAYARHIEKLNSSNDWHAAAFWLEHTQREFAPPRINAAHPEDSPKPALVMTPETIDALSQAYDSQHGKPNAERDST